MEGGGNPTSKDGSPLKRSFVTFDRGGQTGPPRSNDFFFGAADDTRAADDRPAGRPAGRPRNQKKQKTRVIESRVSDPGF